MTVGCVFNIWYHIGHCGSSEPQVDEDVARVLRECVANGKPIGLCCIAPIVAALVLAKEDGMSLKMTLGRRSGEGWPYAATIDKAVEFGITHVEMDQTYQARINGDKRSLPSLQRIFHADAHRQDWDE